MRPPKRACRTGGWVDAQQGAAGYRAFAGRTPGAHCRPFVTMWTSTTTGFPPDTTDIDDFLSVFSGGPCSLDPTCGDVDFNNDGLFPDTADIDSYLSVFSGGPCL
jgi:hypothetical protein